MGACIGNTSQNDKAKNTNKSPLEQYLSYTKDSVFNGTQYLSDNSGHWVCYKYEKVKKDENIINTRPTVTIRPDTYCLPFSSQLVLKQKLCA